MVPVIRLARKKHKEQKRQEEDMKRNFCQMFRFCSIFMFYSPQWQSIFQPLFNSVLPNPEISARLQIITFPLPILGFDILSSFNNTNKMIILKRHGSNISDQHLSKYILVSSKNTASNFERVGFGFPK